MAQRLTDPQRRLLTEIRESSTGYYPPASLLAGSSSRNEGNQMEDADEVECGACADTVPKVSAVAAGWKLVMDTHYDADTGQAILVHEWQCGSCAPGAHLENPPGNGTT